MISRDCCQCGDLAIVVFFIFNLAIILHLRSSAISTITRKHMEDWPIFSFGVFGRIMQLCDAKVDFMISKVSMSMPGFEMNDIKIQWDNGILVIRGENTRMNHTKVVHYTQPISSFHNKCAEFKGNGYILSMCFTSGHNHLFSRCMYSKLL